MNESITTGFAMSSSSLALVAGRRSRSVISDGLLALVERRVLQQVLHAVREVRVPDLRRVLGMTSRCWGRCDGAWKADAAAQSASATARRGIVPSSGVLGRGAAVLGVAWVDAATGPPHALRGRKAELSGLLVSMTASPGQPSSLSAAPP